MKKNQYITQFVFVFISLQLFVSATASAALKIIEKLDLDKDGQITIKEAVADPAVLASFGKIDSDGNGKISSVELAKTKLTPTKEKITTKSD